MEKPTKHILFLYASVGGGHFSVAKAVRATVDRLSQGSVQTDIIDIFDERYTPKALSKMPDLYPRVAKIPELYNLAYRASNGKTRARIVTALNWLYTKDDIEDFIANYHVPIDMIVSTFAMTNGPILNAIEDMPGKPKFITIVTDWGEVHSSWYDKRGDYFFVPTQAVYDDALKNKINPSKIEITGYPTEPEFVPVSGVKREQIRTRLGWGKDAFVVLLMGGARGMGEILDAAKAITKADPNITLAVVAGKNKTLPAKLAKFVREPSKIYGYVPHSEMAQMMQAADVLVSKSGGATIAEAINTNLPIVTYDYTLEQEKANTEFIVKAGVGMMADSAEVIGEDIVKLHKDNTKLAQMRNKCAQVSQPEAAQRIAQSLISWL